MILSSRREGRLIREDENSKRQSKFPLPAPQKLSKHLRLAPIATHLRPPALLQSKGHRVLRTHVQLLRSANRQRPSRLSAELLICARYFLVTLCGLSHQTAID